MDFFVNGGNVFPVRSAFFTEHSGVPERVNVGVRKRGMTLIAAPCSFIFIYSSRSYYPACTNLFIGFTKPLSSLFKTFFFDFAERLSSPHKTFHRFHKTVIQFVQNLCSILQNDYPVRTNLFIGFTKPLSSLFKTFVRFERWISLDFIEKTAYMSSVNDGLLSINHTDNAETRATFRAIP